MKLIKLFVVLNTSLSWLVFVFLTLASLTSNIPWWSISIPLTNALLGLVAYHNLRKLQSQPVQPWKAAKQLPQPTKPPPQSTKPPKPLDETIIKGLVKRGFTPELIKQLHRDGHLTVD